MSKGPLLTTWQQYFPDRVGQFHTRTHGVYNSVHIYERPSYTQSHCGDRSCIGYPIPSHGAVGNFQLMGNEKEFSLGL